MNAINGRILGLAVSVAWLAACGPSQKTPTAPAGPPPAASMPTAPTAMSPMPAMPASIDDWAMGALLFEGLGDFHRTIATKSPEAQQYFDQGMRFLWAFNHDESTRSFARAAQLDPDCAACYWGVALTVGPNYNLPVMAPSRAQVAFDALNKAQKAGTHASPADRALIGALARRYPNAQPLDPGNSAPILTAYAQAMKAVAAQFPSDLDVQTLYAEAMMNLNAWKLWTPDGKAAPGTDEIVATLESVLKRNARHPGANHYYVHALEASPQPGKAVAAAARLRDMMPAAGHLEHMPAHIMQRVGRYEEAAEANRRGAAADKSYFAKTQPTDFYTIMYTGHNYQFLAYSTAMEGRKAETLEAVRNSRETISDEMLLAMPGSDWPLAEEYAATVRFGLWEDMLAKPAPNPKLPALTGGYLYGRGMALASRGHIDEAEAALAQLQRLAASLPADTPAGFNRAKDVFAVATAIVQARIASAGHNPDGAISFLREAVAREDRLAYDEPKDWFFPVRQLLGADLMAAGRAPEAEAVYRKDLEQNPANGWSLFGLQAALRAQNKTDAADEVEREFRAAWKNADVTLTSSAIF
jgi:tetratricopeptide (TPR) repeat protein